MIQVQLPIATEQRSIRNCSWFWLPDADAPVKAMYNVNDPWSAKSLIWGPPDGVDEEPPNQLAAARAGYSSSPGQLAPAHARGA